MPSTTKDDDLVDLHGKVVLLTGGNTGVGYGTIQILARQGAKVYMAARDATKAKAAIEKMDSDGLGEGSVHFLELNLADLRGVSRVAKQFVESEQRLDILINNGAASMGPFHLTDDGFLDILATNYVGPFILTDTLLPLLKRTAAESGSDVRIVNLSSVVHTNVKPTTFATKEALTKDYGLSVLRQLDTYGYSKLMNLLHVKALQTRLDAENAKITCLAVHPGAIATGGSAGFLGSFPYVGGFLKHIVAPLFFGAWSAGGRAVAFAAAAKVVAGRQHEEYKGAYLMPGGVITAPSESALDAKLQTELYETTERAVRELGL
ncbi:NAD-P-binding protein [Mycena alexandri]|uniref:NAD-P-binding protein n=1 Tax=Mycena alexandri TaxID=1745969 RepID=A0AAD6WTJ0_9AGAR|nr:NAD-P-binding protein [Mycena alexandri]